ncbi:HTH-type transcriptional repressor CytR [bacterium BMS3Abin05]|nr:HTH-type transcriptional repressor CytR [bacterium BMS3Abin05]HDK36148.1 LacI family transcriptional regulator [Bacteroidota bacterium]HDZ12915.1 LacI family transcriptional regulator [Bacteroidota bacterium]
MGITIDEIALKAGVSIATVSRALNNNGSIRKETRERIIQIANNSNYKPNSIARSLSRKQTDTIGVILPELVDEFFMGIVRAIEEESYKNKRYILISSSRSQRSTVETLLEFMGSGRVDGVILMAPKMYREIPVLIHKSKRPVVLLNKSKEEDGVVSFNINNYQGAFTVVQHLIEHGYKNIGMIQGPERNCEAEERFRGFKDALIQNNLQLEKSLIVTGNFRAKSGYYGFSRLMSQPKKPDAIFCANDMMATGAYKAARSSHIKIPQDVAVVGFDDIYLSRLLIPRLTTVHVPIEELGTNAVRYLLKMISGEVDPDRPYFEEFSTGLVIGGSCGCVNDMD